MNIIYFLVPASLCLGLFFLALFIWNNKSGQYEDLVTPPIRILNDDPYPKPQQQEPTNAKRPK